MLFEIILYVKRRKAGRVRIGDGEIIAVVENGRRRDPKSASFNDAVKHIMENTDLEPVGQPEQIGQKSHFTTHKHTYRKPGCYVQSRYNKWAVAYEKDGFWWVHRLNRETDTCFRTKSQAMRDVDAWVGYNYVADLHRKTVDKDFETRRAKYLREEKERKEKREAMPADELTRKAAEDETDLFG